jgi:ribosome-associated protein
MSKKSRPTLMIGDRPINLTQVLKLAGWVMSGGEAKSLIADGQVSVNGEVELRKRRQMKAGDVVTLHDGPMVELQGGDAAQSLRNHRIPDSEFRILNSEVLES